MVGFQLNDVTSALAGSLNDLSVRDRKLRRLCYKASESRDECDRTPQIAKINQPACPKSTTELSLWNRQTNLGVVFDSSTGFSLPNGSDRSPDVAWVQKTRIDAIAPDPARFLPLAPDFVVELRSATDKLAVLQQKMTEYQECGVRLGWLIDPQNKQVEIYREGTSSERLDNPAQLSGEAVLPGFILNLADIWA